MKKTDSKTLIIVLMLITIIFMAAAGYFYAVKSGGDNTAKKELAQILDDLGEIMILPEETPTLATVTDPEKLKDQPFFANAKAGDKILIYTTSKKIILYSPTLNKIVEVGTTGEASQ